MGVVVYGREYQWLRWGVRRISVTRWTKESINQIVAYESCVMF
jgi:hypothetical protein